MPDTGAGTRPVASHNGRVLGGATASHSVERSSAAPAAGPGAQRHARPTPTTAPGFGGREERPGRGMRRGLGPLPQVGNKCSCRVGKHQPGERVAIAAGLPGADCGSHAPSLQPRFARLAQAVRPRGRHGAQRWPQSAVSGWRALAASPVRSCSAPFWGGPHSAAAVLTSRGHFACGCCTASACKGACDAGLRGGGRIAIADGSLTCRVVSTAAGFAVVGGGSRTDTGARPERARREGAARTPHFSRSFCVPQCSPGATRCGRSVAC